MQTRDPAGRDAYGGRWRARGWECTCIAVMLLGFAGMTHAFQAGDAVDAGNEVALAGPGSGEPGALPAGGAASLPAVVPLVMPVTMPVVNSEPLPEGMPRAGTLLKPGGGGMPGSRALPPVASPFVELVRKVSSEYGLDPELLHAVIRVESAYQPNAVSPKGAIGLMQVMPQTGARFGFRRLEDPAVNVRAGAHYLKWLLEKFDDNLELALAAYNAGEGAVLRYQRAIPPFPETREYVQRVMARYRPDGADRAGSHGPAATAIKPSLALPETGVRELAAAAVNTNARAASPDTSADTVASTLSRIGLIAGLLLSAPPRPPLACVDEAKPSRGRRARRSARMAEEAMLVCDNAGYGWQR